MSKLGVVIIGGGPAGLMAAEVLSQQGIRVDLYDAMPSVGRKFLLAGIGGLNLTHSESHEPFLARYGARQAQIAPWLAAFDADAVRAWAQGLGVETFVGSSGRVFPKEMKAAPLLRAWLHRLRGAGVAIHARHRWLGWAADGALRFAAPSGEITINASATVLALGGGSWAKLGSDGAWVPLLTERHIPIAPLLPANCGFDMRWSSHFAEKFAGAPLKSVAVEFTDPAGNSIQRRGEFVVTANGIEGSLIYALSAGLRDKIIAEGSATLYLDLQPDRTLAQVTEALTRPRGADSMASHLRRKLGIEGVKAGLLRECTSKDEFADLAVLAQRIKALPLRLIATRPLDEAISSAGGVCFDVLDERLMLRTMPGVFCAGEMLDWEAPTGGYLLTACMASGRVAGAGVALWLSLARQ